MQGNHTGYDEDDLRRNKQLLVSYFQFEVISASLRTYQCFGGTGTVVKSHKPHNALLLAAWLTMLQLSCVSFLFVSKAFQSFTVLVVLATVLAEMSVNNFNARPQF